MFRTDTSGRSHSGSRRSFLQIGSAGLAGLSLGQALRLSAESPVQKNVPAAKNVIMVFLTGGPATIDMWDMKPEAPEAIRGEFRPKATSVPGIEICEYLPRLAQTMKLATLVRSVTHTIAEHTQGQSYVMTGNAPSPSVVYPSLGSLTANLVGSNRGMSAYATLGTVPVATAGVLGTAFDPFTITTSGGDPRQRQTDSIGLPEGFLPEDLARRVTIRDRIDRRFNELPSGEIPSQLNRFQAEAVDILLSDKVNQALDVESESAAIRESYGRSAFGTHALTARRLIEAGARFVTIGLSDWDTHANNFTRLQQTLLPQLDQGLAALLNDLEDRGRLDETIVYCTGEFGRTPAVNGAGGRDHWARTMTSLLAGGGIQRGFVYGATDSDGTEVKSNACSPDDVSASILNLLGFPPAHTIQTRSGRPIAIFKQGTLIAAITGD
jgi:hypothetical protein